MSHGQGKPQNGQGNVREKSGNFVRAHGWTPWPGFNGLSEDNHKTIQETFEFWDKVWLILEVLRYFLLSFLQVGCGKDLTLFALEAGEVALSCEQLSPYPQSPLYPAVKSGRVVHKLFYHVIPEEQKPLFRLVGQTWYNVDGIYHL